MNSRSETLTMNGINKRKTRPNAPRGGRNLRSGGLEKAAYSEGVYTNSRLTHAASSIVGCVVLVEAKDGRQYEGILRTVSSKMDVVLEAAHEVDDVFPQNAIPSKERLIDTIIFTAIDIMSVSALNVDLDYAIKDTFIDSAIGSNKYNGQVGEKELQPWDAEVGADGTLEAIDSPCAAATDNSNGWDPNEMFKTNAERFDVKSSYDPSLSQYTTPLKQENTDEYKKREAQAAKLAQEIERSDAYKQRIALEVGDGDEEEKFSSVVRPGDQSGTPGKFSMKGDDRYVPPHMRKNPGQGRATRSTPQGIPGSGRSSVSSVSSPQPSPTQHSAPVELDSNLNGEKDEVEVTGHLVSDGEPSGATVEKEPTPPVVSKSLDRKLTTHSRDEQIKELKQFSTDFKLSQSEKEKRISPAQSQHALASPSPTTPSSAESVSSITQPSPSPHRTSPATPTAAPSTPPVSGDEKLEKKDDDKLSETLKKSTLNPNAKEFVMNPNAKPFQPKQPVATPPRPATQQSPVMHVQHIPPGVQPGQIYSSYQVVPVSMNMPNVVQQTQQPRFDHRKRAVVSVQPRPDFQSQAAAQRATGAPLLAQPTGIQQNPHHYAVQYMPPGSMGQPGNIPQMVPMPPTTMTATHVMAPPVGGQQHIEQGMQQAGGGQNAIFVSPPGPPGAVQAAAAAAHLGPPPGGAGQPHSHPAPAHMAPHHQPTPPHSQPSQHMNNQGAGGGHAAPSPVQHPVTPGHPPPPQQGGQQMHTHPGPGQGHPTSGTPQPHVIYQQHPVPMSQQGHPPLQPSPHTPTSPQTMYPQTFVASPFFQTSQAPGGGMPQQQQQNPGQQQPGGGPPLSFTHTQPHTTVTHAHHQHSHMGHQGGGTTAQAPAQIVMMPHSPHPSHQQPGVPGPGQMQHPGQHPQLQHAHPIPHHMAGVHASSVRMQAGQAGHMMQQQMGVASANNLPHAQMHYQMHHHQMQQPGPGQGYQHNQ